MYKRSLVQYVRKLKNNIDDEALDLLDKLLVYNPEKRYSAFQCLEHPFFEGISLPEDL